MAISCEDSALLCHAVVIHVSCKYDALLYKDGILLYENGAFLCKDVALYI